jgi:hypothetical protein
MDSIFQEASQDAPPAFASPAHPAREYPMESLAVFSFDYQSRVRIAGPLVSSDSPLSSRQIIRMICCALLWNAFFYSEVTFQRE